MTRTILFLLAFLTTLVGSFFVQHKTDAAIADPQIEIDEPSIGGIRILVLIIACDHNVRYQGQKADDLIYQELQKMWRFYMNSDPQHVEVYFVKADPDLVHDFDIQGDTIWCKGEETWIPGILNKTLISMEAMLPRLDEFQYILRTNLSSFYIFPRLLKFLETIPKENCYCGNAIYWRGPEPFVSGAGIILSTDLVKMLVDQKNQLMNSRDIDDVAIGKFFYHQKVPIIGDIPQRMDFLSLENWEKHQHGIPKDAFHIRAKNEVHGNNRRIPDELIVYSELIKMFYGIDTNQN